MRDWCALHVVHVGCVNRARVHGGGAGEVAVEAIAGQTAGQAGAEQAGHALRCGALSVRGRGQDPEEGGSSVLEGEGVGEGENECGGESKKMVEGENECDGDCNGE